MNGMPRTLAIGALALILVGLLLGAWHGVRVDHETLLVLREQYAPAFAAQMQGEGARARELLAEAQAAQLEHVRVIGAHTHLIKLATVLFIVALAWPALTLSEGRKRLLAAALFAGAILFPLGLLGQGFHPGGALRAATGLGAGLALLAVAGFTVALLSSTARRS